MVSFSFFQARNSQGFWRSLPYQMCIADRAGESTDGAECWNGREAGPYKSALVEDGLANQLHNPEVEIKLGEDVLQEQLFRLQGITNQLRQAHRGQDIAWWDQQESLKASRRTSRLSDHDDFAEESDGSGADDDDDFDYSDMEEGSGRGPMTVGDDEDYDFDGQDDDFEGSGEGSGAGDDEDEAEECDPNAPWEPFAPTNCKKNVAHTTKTTTTTTTTTTTSSPNDDVDIAEEPEVKRTEVDVSENEIDDSPIDDWKTSDGVSSWRVAKSVVVFLLPTFSCWVSHFLTEGVFVPPYFN